MQKFYIPGNMFQRALSIETGVQSVEFTIIWLGYTGFF